METLGKNMIDVKHKEKCFVYSNEFCGCTTVLRKLGYFELEKKFIFVFFNFF